MTLKELRMQKGLNGSEVALQAGIKEPLYSMMETGKRNISVKSARKLSPVLGVPFHVLLDLNEEMMTNDPT